MVCRSARHRHCLLRPSCTAGGAMLPGLSSTSSLRAASGNVTANSLSRSVPVPCTLDAPRSLPCKAVSVIGRTYVVYGKTLNAHCISARRSLSSRIPLPCRQVTERALRLGRSSRPPDQCRSPPTSFCPRKPCNAAPCPGAIR